MGHHCEKMVHHQVQVEVVQPMVPREDPKVEEKRALGGDNVVSVLLVLQHQLVTKDSEGLIPTSKVIL